MIFSELLIRSLTAAVAGFQLGAPMLAVAWTARIACPAGESLALRSLGQRG